MYSQYDTGTCTSKALYVHFKKAAAGQYTCLLSKEEKYKTE